MNEAVEKFTTLAQQHTSQADMQVGGWVGERVNECAGSLSSV